MLVNITADPKEDWDTGGEYHEPGSEHPPLESITASLGDLLADQTRRAGQFSWAVRSVTPARASSAVTPAGDGTARIGTDWYCATMYGWLFASLVPAVGKVHVFDSRPVPRGAGALFPGAVVHSVPAGDGLLDEEATAEIVTAAAVSADVTVFFTARRALAVMLRSQGVSAWLGR